MKQCIKNVFLLSIVFCAWVQNAHAQLQGTHEVAQFTHSVANLSHYYYRYLPPEYDQNNTGKKYPLIVFFHGNGKRYTNESTDINRVTEEALPEEIKFGND